MKYAFEINTMSKTIRVITEGNLTIQKAAAMGLEILMKAKELKCKIIFDHRLSKNKISITDAYYWFPTHYDNIDMEFRKIPTAYIVNNTDLEFYSFFECTCTNKGIPIKVFQDENAVLKWLESL